MELVLLTKRLRPDVTWKNKTVNGFSLATIKKTYQSSQPMPTIAEHNAKNIILKYIKDTYRQGRTKIEYADDSGIEVN